MMVHNWSAALYQFKHYFYNKEKSYGKVHLTVGTTAVISAIFEYSTSCNTDALTGNSLLTVK